MFPQRDMKSNFEYFESIVIKLKRKPAIKLYFVIITINLLKGYKYLDFWEFDLNVK